jgi:pimeloyl-ACP methyl ester carboxylesterase
MAKFVAVHGAMHGGWAWSPVRRLLEHGGHELFAPTLTGQGDRAHQLDQNVGVDTHVEDVTSLLYYEDITDAVLVLHSYAGILAGPIVGRAEGRVGRVIVAGGFYARPGQCLLDVEPPETADRYRALANEHGDGWRIPATDAFLAQWGITDPELTAFVGPRLVDFPLKAQTDPVEFDPTPLAALPRTYIEHTDPPLPSLAISLDAALADGFAHKTMPSGHDMMLADPQMTANLLTEIAQDPDT